MPNVPRYRLFSGIKKRNSFQAAVCQYAERDAIGLITPLLLGYSVVTCLPAVHKRDDLRLFACFLISPRLMGGDFFACSSALTVVSAGSQPLPRPAVGTLPRNRLASSAAGGASALSSSPAPKRKHHPSGWCFLFGAALLLRKSGRLRAGD